MGFEKRIAFLKLRTPFLVLVVGFTASTILFLHFNRLVWQQNRARFQQAVEQLRPVVEHRFSRLEELGTGIQQYVSVRKALNRYLWQGLTPFPHPAMQSPELTVLGYVERVSTAGVSEWISRLRQEGGSPPAKIRLSDAPVHWLVKYGYPASRESSWVGLDLTATGFFQKIWLSGQPTDVPSIQFGMSSPVTKKPCILMLFPHFGLSRPVGWFFLDIDPSLLFKGALSQLQTFFNLQIALDRKSKGLMAQTPAAPFFLPGSLRFEQETGFTILQSRRPFRVSGWIPPLNSPESFYPYLILLAGWLVTFFIAYFIGNMGPRPPREELEPKGLGRFLSALTGNLPGLVYRRLNDRNGTMEWVSNGSKNITGYLPESFTGPNRKGFNEIIHSDDRERVWNAVQDAIHARKSFELTYRIQTAGRTVKWVLETGQGAYSSDGSLQALEGVVLDVTGKRKTEEALQDRERFLTSIMYSLPGMVFRCLNDKDWSLEYVSEGCRDLTGYPLEEFAGPLKRSLGEILHPADRELVRASVEKSLEQGNPFVFNSRIRTAFGKEKWVYGTGRGVHAPDGKVLGLEGFLSDVTDHRLAEIALKESGERYRTLMESVPDAVFILEDIHFFYLNPAACRLLGGKKPEEFAERSVMDLVHPDFHALVRQRIQQHKQGAEHPGGMELRYIGLDGVTRDAEALFMKISYQGQNAILVASRDITERQKTDAALKKSLHFAQQLIETANAMVVGLDAKGNITFFNEAAETISGYTREEMKGRNWFETIVPRKRYPHVWEEFQRLMEGGLPVPFENPIITHQGEERFILWRNSGIREDGRMIGILSIGIDITEGKKTERALAQSEKDWEDTFNGISDWVALLDPQGRILRSNRAAELMFGLNPKKICGRHCYEVVHATKDWKPNCPFPRMLQSNRRETAEFLLKEGGPWIQVTVDPIHNPLGQLVKVVHIARDITERRKTEQALRDNLLLFSSITTKALPFEPVDMAQVVREGLTDLEELISESGATVESGELPFLDADPVQMRQLIQNLIRNALKYKKKDHPLQIMIQATIDIKSTPPQYQLTVEDNGIGIEDKHLDRIFNIFQHPPKRDEYEETDTGLAICKRIVERHGGTITVSSKPAIGSIFRVSLPAVQSIHGEKP